MIRTRGKFVSYGELWFDDEPREPQPGILVFRQRLVRADNVDAREFVSLVNDLTGPQELLWEGLDKATRYEVRRAETKDRLACAIIYRPTPGQITAFAEFYDSFAATKNLGRCSRTWLAGAAEAGQLSLTSVRSDDTILSRHAYVTCGAFARLYQSASCAFERSPAFSQLLGRANRLLHWNDMIALKRLGFEVYDWGGITPSPKSAPARNINRFKMEFGGRERLYYNWVSPVSMLGRLYTPLRAFWTTRRARWHRHSRTAEIG